MRSSRLSSRASSRQLAQATSTPVVNASPAPQPASTQSPQLLELRRQWKWAAVSQFYFTFARLFALDDVSAADIEDDLANSTMRVLPRVMYRLLVTLTQDRKMTLETWQASLRRQYLRRDPSANPLGEEVDVKYEESRDPTAELDDKKEGASGASDTSRTPAESLPPPDDEGEAKEKIEDEGEANEKEDEIVNGVENDSNEPTREQRKDWADLTMLQKLDSIHMVMEWHFHNPSRFRQVMKSDDEYASWRIEPIGYDTKQNAYWYIGPDRLWIQRAKAKPPRRKSTKRKSNANKSKSSKRGSSPIKASMSHSKRGVKDEIVDEDDEDDEFTIEPATPNRRKRGAKQVEPPPTPQTASRSRAAKTRANAKLDIQAKQLEAIKNEMRSFSRGRVPRGLQEGTSSTSSPRPLGTRMSKRLRADADDDEWQQIPAEWLESGAEESEVKEEGGRAKRRRVAPSAPAMGRRSSTRMAMRKERELLQHDADGDDEREDDDEENDGDAEARDSEREGRYDVEKNEMDGPKTGLESDDESELTQLSEDDGEGEEEAREASPSRKAANSKAARQKQAKGKGKSGKGKAKARSKTKAAVVKEEDEQEDEKLPEPEPEPESELEPEVKEDENFVEWECICVTLQEWEEIGARFQGATHYLEKALHKVLSQEIVPYVVDQLKERERQLQKELLLMQRKRSSRLAVRESEKEAVRAAALKKAEEDEKMARTRRMEARAAKEEEERRKREEAREQRRKEREERELKRAMRKEAGMSDMEVDVTSTPAADTPEPAAAANGKAHPESSAKGSKLAKGAKATKRQPSGSANANATSNLSANPSVLRKSGKKKLSADDWELDCEICGSKGINRDEDVPLMSCGKCNRWQHIPCHDSADARAGRPKRNWDVVDFTCQRCLDKRNGSGSKKKLLHVHPQPSPARHHPSLPQGHPNGYGEYPEEPAFVPAYSKRDIPRQSNTGVTFAHYQPLQQGFRAESTPRLLLSPHGVAQTGEASQQGQAHTQAFPSYTNGHASLGTNGYSTVHAGTPSSSIRTQFEATGQYGGQPIQLPPPRVDLNRPAPSSTWIPYSSPGAPQQPPVQPTQFRDGYPASLYPRSSGAPSAVYTQHQSQPQQAYQHYAHPSYPPTASSHASDNRLSPPGQYASTNNRHTQQQYNNPHVYSQSYPSSLPAGHSLPHPQTSTHSQLHPQQPESR